MERATTLSLRVAALTHIGRRRELNEDCIAIGARVLSAPIETPWVTSIALREEPAVCLVADGMGGHPAGDVASRMVIEELSATLPDAYATDADLVAALRKANQRLFAAMQGNPAHVGMGTTIAGITVSSSEVSIFNVGDSRIYRVNGRKLEQISVDDSESTDASCFAWLMPSRVLVQCLGGYPEMEEIEPHVAREMLEPGSSYLLCSDGLHDMLSDRAIQSCVRDDPVETVSALFEGAMAAGGSDNISIIYALIEESGRG